jgi:hypothetical protein
VDSNKCISLQAPGHGPMQLGLLDGQTTDQCGPVLRLARHSPVLARKRTAHCVAAVLSRALEELATSYALSASMRGLPTGAISGPSFGDSSPSANLQSHLESRLLVRMGAFGSPEYELRWKYAGMPLGGRILRQRASERRTSETGFTGWRSPNVREKGGGDYVDPEKAMARITSGHQVNLQDEVLAISGWPTASARDRKDGRASQATLDRNARPLNEVVTQVAGWTTPQSHDAAKPNPDRCNRFGTKHGGRNLNDEAAQLSGWASPVVPNGGRKPKGGAMSMTGQTPDGKKRQVDLDWQIRAIAGWMTPNARDWKSEVGSENNKYNKPPNLSRQAYRVNLQDSGTTTNSSDQIPKGVSGALASEFVAWLQGLTEIWMYAPQEKLSRSSRKASPTGSPSSAL